MTLKEEMRKNREEALKRKRAVDNAVEIVKRKFLEYQEEDDTKDSFLFNVHWSRDRWLILACEAGVYLDLSGEIEDQKQREKFWRRFAERLQNEGIEIPLYNKVDEISWKLIMKLS